MSELLVSRLAPGSCRWCELTNGVSNVNGLDSSVRSALKWKDTGGAATFSDFTAFALTPLASMGFNAVAAHHDGKDYQLLVDGMLIAEGAVLTSDFTQIVKFTAGRERPFVSVLAPADKPKTATPAENNLSFFSGHTSFAFALATGAGTVASYRGYRWAPWVWVAGMTFAAGTGYLRIAADKHYLSDVLTGAVAGAAFGFGIPWLHHRSRSTLPPVVTVQKTASAAVLGVSWAW